MKYNKSIKKQNNKKTFRNKSKKNQKKYIRNKKNQRYKTKVGSGKYIYYPKENMIQFMPYSYPNISNSNQIYQQPYLGSQMGGNSLLPTQCGDFNPNMLDRKFDCNQPFWSVKCT